MIFLKLFYIFSYIGLFNFGGGYAMLSFIQQEIVEKQGWLSEAEFTDIVAISQMTPGPIGINCATYVGYTSVVNDPWVQSLEYENAAHILGIFGSFLATLSVIWLPFIVMIWVSKLILKHKDSVVKKSIFEVLRPAIIGLLASAALALMNEANFGQVSRIGWSSLWTEGDSSFWAVDSVHNMLQFVISMLIFVAVFVGVRRFKWNIIYTTLCCGILGIFLYGFLGL